MLAKSFDNRCGSSPGRLKLGLAGFLALIVLSLLGTPPQAAFAARQSASEVSRTMDEDGAPRAFSLMLYGADADGDTLKWSIAQQPEHGVASVATVGSAIKVNYHPNENWNGTDHFFVRLTDAFGGANRIRVTVHVIPVNELPVNRKKPRIVGNAKIGQTLKVENGQWGDSTDGQKGVFAFSYQWLRSTDATKDKLVPIEGEVSRQYVVTEEDQNAYLAVRVTASDEGGRGPELSASATSGLRRVGNQAPMISLAAPEKTFVLSGFKFEGNHSHTAKELTATLKDYIGQPVSLSSLNEAANKITKYYHETSKIIANAYIPPQELEDGTVRMVIVEGKLGNVTVSGNTNYTSKFIRQHITGAVNKSPLRSSDLERALLTLNQNPGLQVRSVLERGSQPGTVDVHVAVKDKRPIGLSLAYNNYGSDSISRNRYIVGLDLINPMNFGGHLSAQVVVGDNPRNLTYGSGKLDVPVGNRGTRVGVTASQGFYDVPVLFADLGLKGNSSSSSIFVRQPLILSRDLILTGEISLESRDDNFFLLGVRTSADRIRTVNILLDASLNILGGNSIVAAKFTQGLGGFLGGLKNGSHSSRKGGDNQFARIVLSAAHSQPISSHWSIYGALSGQWTDDSLVTGEELQIGGVGSVRGYVPGEQIGDYGYRSSVELRYAYQGRVPWVAYSFIDHAHVWRYLPFISQDKGDLLTGAGLGLNMQYKVFGLTTNIIVDIGWPITPSKNSLGQRPVANLSASTSY